MPSPRSDLRVASRRLSLLTRLTGAAGVVAAALLPATGTAAPSAAASPAVEQRAHALFDTTGRAVPAGLLPGGTAAPLQPRVRPAAVTGAMSPAGAARDPEVLGFAQSGEIVSGNWKADLHLDLLSTVAYFGVNVNPDGSLVTNDFGYSSWASGQMTEFMNAAHARGVRVVLTVKAFSDGVIGSVVNSEPNRQRLVQALAGELAGRGGDGVNVDFEGFAAGNAPGYTQFIAELKGGLRSALPGRDYLTIDTYASAALGGTMYNIQALRPVVDAFDVMAYDFTSAGSATAGPTAPLDNYSYNDRRVVREWLSQVPAGQVILGVPYYGYKWTVQNNGRLAPAQPGTTGSADTYSSVLSDLACGVNPSVQWDGAFSQPWATWWSPATNDPCGGNRNSFRELYFDNADSLGLKYDLVNGSNLRGIGIWSLGMDSGHGELWNEIALKFTVSHGPVGVVAALPATETATRFTVTWGLEPGSSAATGAMVWVRDGSLPWSQWAGGPVWGSAPFNGVPGHTYGFYTQVINAQGQGNGVPGAGSAPHASTALTANAARALPFGELYAVDAYGNLHGGSSPPQAGPTWPGWPIVRGIASRGASSGGYVLDGYGGVHPFGAAPAATASATWVGWDIARGIALRGDGSSGFTLDGWGGLHPFGGAPAVQNITGYWPGFDIGRGVVLRADGTSGYTLDGWGGVHPFGGAPGVQVSAYWPGWDIARGIVLRPDGVSGYVLDGYGGLHPFGNAPAIAAPAYWAYWDIARGVTLLPGSGSAGYTVDGWGGFHPFGGAPAVDNVSYPGRDIIRGVSAQ